MTDYTDNTKIQKWTFKSYHNYTLQNWPKTCTYKIDSCDWTTQPFGPNWQLGGQPYRLLDLLHSTVQHITNHIIWQETESSMASLFHKRSC